MSKLRKILGVSTMAAVTVGNIFASDKEYPPVNKVIEEPIVVAAQPTPTPKPNTFWDALKNVANDVETRSYDSAPLKPGSPQRFYNEDEKKTEKNKQEPKFSPSPTNLPATIKVTPPPIKKLHKISSTKLGESSEPTVKFEMPAPHTPEVNK